MSKLLAGAGLAVFLAGALIVAQGRPAPFASATPSSAAGASSTASASPTAAPIPPGYRVQIPRLRIDLAILEGDVERDAVAQRTPEGFAFHLPGSAIPGAGANAFIYAHARAGMFIALWDVRVGDEVWVSTPDGRALRYVVSEIHPRVPPDDVSWAASSAPERLTLQTSTGPNPGDPRFVVVALPG
jgi:sortase (surface protein transpeptidase)